MKAAEQTPLTALRLAELVKEAGYPDGVLNMLTGYGETTGRHLATHPGIDKIAFTGSSAVGLEIMANSSKNGLKHVSLELGGKSPNIICEDAKMDLAISQATGAVLFNAGQCCNAGTRTLVHESLYDEFVERSTEEFKKVKLGDQFTKGITQGPLISEEQHQKVLGYLEQGKKEGATVTVGGGRHGDKGFHVQPTVFADVKDDMTIAKEEIFGPVMSILKFSDLDDAIARANNTEYGLAAAVCTESIDNALYVSNALRAGQVYVNCYGAPLPNIPFGGYKNSGIGRELGPQGLDNYLETKTVIMSRPEGSLP